MSGPPTRVGVARFYADLVTINTATNVNTSADAGVLVPDGFRHEIGHVAATKGAKVNVKLWGYSNLGSTAARWVQFGNISFTENDDEVYLVRGMTAFLRVQTTVNAIGATNVNTYIGFSE